MAMHFLKYLLSCLFICWFLVGNCENYTIVSEQLNLREKPNPKSSILMKLNQGEIITSIGEINNWIKVEIDGQQGYLNKRYLQSTNKQATVKEQEIIGFKAGFNHVFLNSFIVVYIVYGSIYALRNNRKKDNRFRKGYKEIPLNFIDLIKIGVVGGIVSLPIALIAACFYWIKSF